MTYPYQHTPIANKSELIAQYLGKSINELPTPSLIINKSKFISNCQRMRKNANSLGVKFRAHVKTHKTLEGTELQLGSKIDRIVVSTMMEAWNIVKECKQIKDIHYSLPAVKSNIPQYAEFSNQVDRFSLMIDNFDQIKALVDYRKFDNRNIKKWSIFVKVDQGSHRAGLEINDQTLIDLIMKLLTDDEIKSHIELFGFYCHAGNSYSVFNESSARDLLIDEIKNVNAAAKLAKSIDPNIKLVLSIGATPTAHASELLTTQQDLLNDLQGDDEIYGELELHAGNYPCCDLQQLSTNCIDQQNISLSVLAEVVSTYPNRGDKSPGEQLINAGVLSLARESSSIPGFGKIVKPEGYGNWIVGKLSQEHGILMPNQDQKQEGGSNECKFFPYGTKLRIIPQHSCIAAACFPYYFIVGDDDETIEDIWIPFRGW